MPTYSLRKIADIKEDVLSAYSPLTRRLLLGRGITSEKDAEVFLNPNWERDTHDPFLMKDMQKVVDRIMSAMSNGELIAIWSDYDMDGIPGAALFYDLFRTLGYEQVIHHTPHRNKDGFGLNEAGLDELKKEGADLVITIDCGIGDVDMVAHANKLGLEVIVTDHHIPHETLPAAHAILNPKQKECAYPEKMLCGAGVIFKLVQAILMYTKEHPDKLFKGGAMPGDGWEKWLLDMAGMSTVADMVPLVGENRTLAYFGLMVLKKSRRPGLQALLKKARANQRYLTEDDIAFTIAPRVNAASRMGHASDAFALLSTTDEKEAGALAVELDSINTKRKTAVATMKREINRKLEKLGEPKSVIVLGNPDWKPSLLGLVASSLADDLNRPVFLWGKEAGISIKGSCRSDGVCSVFALMSEASEHFSEFGGHDFAGGFSLEQEQVHALEAALVEAHAKLGKKGKDKEIFYDEVLSPENVTWDTYNEVARLAPFGEGNKKPLFLFRGVELAGVKTFGKGNDHLELALRRTTGVNLKAIRFFTTPDSFDTEFHQGEKIDIVANLEASYFMGRPELRLRLVDIIS